MTQRPPGDAGDEPGGQGDDAASDGDDSVGRSVGPGGSGQRPGGRRPDDAGLPGDEMFEDYGPTYRLTVRPDPPPTPPTPAAGSKPVGIPDGPLTRELALALLDKGAELVANGDYRVAAGVYQRVIGFDDPAITAAALLGLGEALYRLDLEDQAVRAWEDVLKLPETPSTYPAWRNVAAARVRQGDLRGAIDAYHQADRRAPQADKAEIASRLGWLSKQTGNQRAAGRYFRRSRGDVAVTMSLVLLGVTAVISLIALPDLGGSFELQALLAMDKPAVANGELWRIWTVTLVHADPLHLLFNGYALFLAGPVVEQMYGRVTFLVFYLVSAAGGSIGTYAFGPAALGVGASGAIFGLFGIVLAASRTHNPVLDRQGRSFVSQIGGLIVLNIVFGFALSASIDNFAHLGGLAVGLALGYLIPPGRVQTLRSMWQQSRAPGAADTAMRLAGLTGVAVVLVIGFIYGTSKWDDVPDPLANVGSLSVPGPVVATRFVGPTGGYAPGHVRDAQRAAPVFRVG